MTSMIEAFKSCVAPVRNLLNPCSFSKNESKTERSSAFAFEAASTHSPSLSMVQSANSFKAT